MPANRNEKGKTSIKLTFVYCIEKTMQISEALVCTRPRTEAAKHGALLSPYLFICASLYVSALGVASLHCMTWVT